MSFLHDLTDWLADNFIGVPSLASKLPKVEAKDGQEPTVESLRIGAREAAAKDAEAQPKNIPAASGKALDKEFWETL